jgi:uncharacterized membrane protein YdbT with pleckstrin-like domain
VAFPRKLLNEHEEIVLDLRPHWWFLAGPIATLVAAVVVSLVLQNVTENDVVTLLCVGIIVAAMLWLLGRYIRWMGINFVVTTDRLIYRHGVIAKSGIEIPLERVNNVIFNQTLLERMLGAGDLLIESGGESGQQRFSDIRHPAQVQNEIHIQMEANENRKYDRMASRAHAAPRGTSSSILDQLDKLDQLRQRGVLTQAEFDAKKAQLLERM